MSFETLSARQKTQQASQPISEAPEQALTGQQNLLTAVAAVLGQDESFHRKVFCLSQFIRRGFEKALEAVSTDAELVRPLVTQHLETMGYRRTPRDPRVLLNPVTKEDGWIIELSEGTSLWGGPFIVAGYFEGKTSKDLQRVMEWAKYEITTSFLDTLSQCKGAMSDQSKLLFESPWHELRAEARTLQDTKRFFVDHPEHKKFFAALFSYSP